MKIKRLHFIYFLLFMVLISCRKDDNTPPVNTPICLEDGSYAEFSKERKELENPSILIGPFYFNKDTYNVGAPVFNPQNNNQIAYAKVNTPTSTINEELWIFDFCNMESQQISDNFYYNLDWSIQDWILYTGTDQQIFKIRSNGEGRTQLTFSESIQRAGKWSPDGSRFFVTGDDAFKILDENGTVIYTKAGLMNYKAIDWIDNEHLLIVHYSADNFQTLNIHTGEIVLLQVQSVCRFCSKVYDREQHSVYIHGVNGDKGLGTYLFDLKTGKSTFFLSHNDSYSFKNGDIQHQSPYFLTTLKKKEWKDSLLNEIYVSQKLILLSRDGKEERIIALPH